MKVVLDASVALKWIFDPSAKEPDQGAALALLRKNEAQEIELLQPSHWITEVMAVVARQNPERSRQALAILRGTRFTLVDDDNVYLRGSELAVQLKQHMFDTLYHAVALERGAVLVTADDRYFAAARCRGHIQQLTTFDPSRGA